MLSIIIPAYNESKLVNEITKRLDSLMHENKIEYELLFIDDGSFDDTWKYIEKVSDNNIRGIHFSRNFGKEAAIIAGLKNVKGDCCVIIDCDLQHPPEKIIDMYNLYLEGYEVVEGIKTDRGQETRTHKLFSKMFYSLFSKSIGFDMQNTSDFKLLDRKVIDSLKSVDERNLFFRGLSSWVGFKTTQVYYEVNDREVGESKWSFKLLTKYAINNITSFTTAPMQIITALGSIMLVVSIVFGLISLVQKILGKAVPGFTTVIILLLFSSSIIMISLGIIGYYIAKIYEEVKRRPRYIISETCGGKNE